MPCAAAALWASVTVLYCVFNWKQSVDLKEHSKEILIDAGEVYFNPDPLQFSELGNPRPLAASFLVHVGPE